MPGARRPLSGNLLGHADRGNEFARNVLGLSEADSSEFKPDGPDPVIDLMPDQQGNLPKGGTMRLGAYPCKIHPGTFLEKAYGCGEVQERHRHRYEFNNRYRDAFCQHGMIFSGTSPDNRLVEAVELTETRFTSACSSIRNSSPAPTARIRCSGNSSRPPASKNSFLPRQMPGLFILQKLLPFAERICKKQ